MEGTPPPYNSAASSQTPLTRSPANEAIVFVEAVIQNTFNPNKYATAYLYRLNGSIYHAHEKKRYLGSRENRIQLIRIKEDIGYKALVDQIVLARCNKKNLEVVAGGWKRSKAVVAGLQVVWEDLREGDRRFESWLSGISDTHDQTILKKMAQRGFKDRLVIHFRVVEGA
jgi:hypothetical protein